MFSLQLSDAQQGLEKDLRAFGLANLRPNGLAAERERSLPDEVIAGLERVGEQLETVTETRDIISMFVGIEALAFGDPGIANTVIPSLQASLLIRAAGSAEQKEALLPRTAANQSVKTSYLFYEGYGRGANELQTIAAPGTDGWLVTGRKVAVQHPAAGDLSVLVAADDTGTLKAFAYGGTPPGITSEKNSWTTGALGGAVSPSGTVHLLDVHLSEAERLGEDDAELLRAVALARLLPSAIQIGTAHAAVEYAVGWVTKREAWGKPLGAYQGVAFKLVEVDTEVDSARLTLWDAAVKIARTSDPRELDRIAGQAVRTANNVACYATREGIQLLGVHGIITEHPQERFWRHASTQSLIDFDPLNTSLSLV
jgi:alkylation response protein AidB-like acyl-CoA dehydrogenase